MPMTPEAIAEGCADMREAMQAATATKDYELRDALAEALAMEAALARADHSAAERLALYEVYDEHLGRLRRLTRRWLRRHQRGG
jgi:hypothetical protein